MAISFVGSLPPVGANNGGNVTLTFSNLVDSTGASAALQENDLVIVGQAESSSSDNVLATSSSGWTKQADIFSNGSNYDTDLAVYTKIMGATPDTSIVLTGPGGSVNGHIGVAVALRGVDTSTPLDISVATVTGTGTSCPDPGSVTPLTSGAWIVVVGAGAAATGAAFTNPGDLSSTTNHFRSANHVENNDIAIGFGLKTDWTSGAFDGSAWTGGNVAAGNSWAAVVLVIKPAVTVPSVTPDNSTHSHSATSPTVAAFSSVTPDNATHSHSATSPTIAANSVITAANCNHSHNATSPTIAANSVITAANCNHNHSATSPTVATNSTITSDNATHGHSATSPTVAANSVITTANCNHSHSATEPTVIYNAVTVTPANCNHAHSATEPVVTSSVTSFTADNCSHGLESDNVILLFTPKRRRRVIRGKALHARSSWRRVGMSGYFYVS